MPIRPKRATPFTTDEVPRRDVRDAFGPMTLNTEQRRALAVLADTGWDGAAEAILAARFGVEVLAGLVRKGWVRVDVETVCTGGRTFDVVRMRITAAGRLALAA
jgi:hypothetical protein